MTALRRVSIGIPTINRSDLALRAIRSALAQTYSDVEVIVSDDASTDDTVARVQEIRDPRLVLVQQKQRLGLVGNFDFCLRHATGEFFLLLGDDDILLPNAIEKLVQPFLLGKPPIPASAIGVAWCPCRIASAANSQFWTTEAGPEVEPVSSLLTALFAGNRGPRLTSILLRTQDAIAVGGYESKYGDLCDIGNWGRAALLREYAVCIPEPLVQYTNHLGSTTSQSAIRQWQQWARVVHCDLLTSAEASQDASAAPKLKSAKRNFISGITLTILIQTIGKPGWIGKAIRESMHSPSAFFTPYMFRRLLKDGRKVFTVRRHAKPQPNSPSPHGAAESHPAEKVS
ncbi:MAG TPA: glycosyltransferase family 2 protein [Acidobacteriaceae bacterium]|nr:glycosyltransferase family 2 protein [Acidobacteriaceae bacterium]